MALDGLDGIKVAGEDVIPDKIITLIVVIAEAEADKMLEATADEGDAEAKGEADETLKVDAEALVEMAFVREIISNWGV